MPHTLPLYGSLFCILLISISLAGCFGEEPDEIPQNLVVPKYQRSDWPHWSDTDGNCVNTRHEILIRRSTGPIELSENNCRVISGLWIGPFSGSNYTLASDLDIDHVIPLKWAHSHGGYQWSKAEKGAFANDPLNLLAVDDGLNQSKGAKGPDDWLPPNIGYQCRYVKLWQSVLKKYSDLKLSAEEERVFTLQRDKCE